MIKIQLLNSTASLNDYILVSAVNFIPGENLTIALQIQDVQKNIRYIPPVAATMNLTFIDKDGNDLVKAAAKIDPDDRSLWNVVLSQAETEILAGQNIIVDLDVNGDQTVILKALVANGIIRNNLSGDC